MRGQKGLFPSRAHRNCLTWSDKMTAVHHLHQQQHQWYSSAGGRWGRNTGDAAEIYQSSYLEREHMTCSNGIGRVLSVSSVSGHAEISFSSHRKRKKTLVLMDCVDAGAIFPWCEWKNRNKIIVHGRREPLGWLQPVYHIKYHTRVKQEWWRRGERRERETEREGGGEGSVRARVCARLPV